MELSVIGTFLGYVVVSSFTPGPGNLLALNDATSYGLKKSRNIILGICCGYGIVQFLCTLALYIVNRHISSVLFMLKYIGGAYICFLALHIMFSKKSEDVSVKSPSFKSGCLLQLVNVKIYFYIITLITTYFIPNFPTITGLTLAGIGVVAVGCSATITWALVGAGLKNFFNKYYSIINVVMGVFLLYCAWDIIRSN